MSSKRHWRRQKNRRIPPGCKRRHCSISQRQPKTWGSWIGPLSYAAARLPCSGKATPICNVIQIELAAVYIPSRQFSASENLLRRTLAAQSRAGENHSLEQPSR
jgi:hypothetical protein